MNANKAMIREQPPLLKIYFGGKDIFRISTVS